jgi:hypothetical protein
MSSAHTLSTRSHICRHTQLAWGHLCPSQRYKEIAGVSKNLDWTLTKALETMDCQSECKSGPVRRTWGSSRLGAPATAPSAPRGDDTDRAELATTGWPRRMSDQTDFSMTMSNLQAARPTGGWELPETPSRPWWTMPDMIDMKAFV